jgi:hypothetical protein
MNALETLKAALDAFECTPAERERAQRQLTLEAEAEWRGCQLRGPATAMVRIRVVGPSGKEYVGAYDVNYGHLEISEAAHWAQQNVTEALKEVLKL